MKPIVRRIDDLELSDIIREGAVPLLGSRHDYDALLEMIGEARFVLLGEASHGTHEFYQARADITRRLILEKGFTVVAVEADWPDSYRVNRYVRGQSQDKNAEEALIEFKRFPNWMWRNRDVVPFVEWLKEHNSSPEGQPRQAGFYGLDLYSLNASIHAVLEYLEKTDPKAAARARVRYSCFDRYESDPETYARYANWEPSETCQTEVLEQLVEMQRAHANRAQAQVETQAGNEDDFFFAEQNARLVKNAEEYYRTMFVGQESSWNLRDRHMAETVEALSDYLHQPKMVIWEHNSHLGDARATQMSERGELNVGQLVREKHGTQAVLVGFTTYSGTVTAATNWGDTPKRKKVVPAMADSYEKVFHQVGIKQFYLNLRDPSGHRTALRNPMLERAIGVIYLPQTERVSHYFQARLSDQFDAVIHLDQTQAVEPLERQPVWDQEEYPETYPFGV